MEEKLFKKTIVTLHGNDFTIGYHEGYLHYLVCYRGFPCTEKEIYDLLSTTINSVLHSSRYNTGFILGWSAAFRRDQPVPCVLCEEGVIMESIKLPVGNSHIQVNGDEFTRGFRQGYDVYMANDKGKTFSEGELHIILSERLLKGYGTIFCTGWIFGWMGALYAHSPSSANGEAITNS